MGNSSSITEETGPVDYTKLHAFLGPQLFAVDQMVATDNSCSLLRIKFRRISMHIPF